MQGAGTTLVALFKDQGISGSELDRPGLNGLKAFLQSSEQRGPSSSGSATAWCGPRTRSTACSSSETSAAGDGSSTTSNLAFVPPEVAAKLGGHIAGWQARIAEIDREAAADAQRQLDQKSFEAIADEVIALLGQVDRVIAGAPRDEVRAFYVRAVERIELRFTTTEAATKAGKGPKAGSGAEQTAHVTAGSKGADGVEQTPHVTTRRRHTFEFGTIKTNAPLASQRGVTSSLSSSGGERAHCATTASRVTC